MIAPLENLERALSKLPGLGRRSASRAALALVREPARLMEPLLAALRAAQGSVRCCSRCGAFTTVDCDPCATCTDVTRDGSILCVVEEPADIVSIESSGAFRGRYHALGGKLSPAHHTGPEKLRFAELKDRVVREGVTEVLLGTGAKVTRLAFGLPTDSGVAYSDPLTLKRAIVNRVAQ